MEKKTQIKLLKISLESLLNTSNKIMGKKNKHFFKNLFLFFKNLNLKTYKTNKKNKLSRLNF